MTKTVAVIGGGPAGLMAAEILAQAGQTVTVYEQKPSLGRKFLMAGRGGLNLTHSEEFEKFLPRYGAAEKFMTPLIESFTPQMLRAWADDLGLETFIGTSGRVFPKMFKASPLLRAWLLRLEKLGVQFKLNHHWLGWRENNLIFKYENKEVAVAADAVLLALGGASWPRLGSDGAWTEILQNKKIEIMPLRPANCGFQINWSDIFKNKYAGQPVKSVALLFNGIRVPGEIMITQGGIEGGPVYALSTALRDAIAQYGSAELAVDLRPDMTEEQLTKALQRPRAALSFTNYLRKAISLSSPAIGLLLEQPNRAELGRYSPPQLAALLKSVPLTLTGTSHIERAISTAGGIALSELDNGLMLKKLPGVFAAGEMLDWEAPTGGYLLQGCFATGAAAAHGIINFLN